MADYPMNQPQGPQEGMPTLLYRIALYLWGAVTGKFSLTTKGINNGWQTFAVTIAGGGGYTNLPASSASYVLFINSSGESLDMLSPNAALGQATIPSNTAVTIPVLANSGEVSVRRTSQAAGTVTSGGIIQL